MFGQQGKVEKRISQNNSQKKNDFPRVSVKYRYWMKSNTENSIIFLDDVAKNFSDAQAQALNILGLVQGPFTLREHRIALPKKNGQGLDRSNYFTCLNDIVADPQVRLMYFRTLAWDQIGSYLDECFITDLAKCDAVYKDRHLDVDLFAEILSEKQLEMLMPVLSLATGQSMTCPLCTGVSGSRVPEGDRPKTVTFRTIIDEGYENRLKLLGTTWTTSDTLQENSDEFKDEGGMQFRRFKVKRPEGDKVAATGTVFFAKSQLTPQKVAEINPDAVICLTREKIHEIINADHKFAFHVYRAKGGEKTDPTEVANTIADLLNVGEEGVWIPNTPNYFELLLGKTPDFIKRIITGDASPSKAEDRVEKKVLNF